MAMLCGGMKASRTTAKGLSQSIFLLRDSPFYPWSGDQTLKLTDLSP